MNIQDIDLKTYKKRVGKRFSGAASRYDCVSPLQQSVGRALLEILPQDNNTKGYVLDLGSGTGFFLNHLITHYPEASILALDLSESMLRYRRAHLKEQVLFIQADAEHLPLKRSSIQRIFSNFVLQWCLDLRSLLKELARVLVARGEVYFTTLAAGSLCELEVALKHIDSRNRINNFSCADELQKLCKTSQFDICVWQKKTHKLWYADLQTLMRSFKDLGANTAMFPTTGLCSRGRFAKLTKNYEYFRTPRGLPVTYEVVYGHLRSGKS